MVSAQMEISSHEENYVLHLRKIKLIPKMSFFQDFQLWA